MCVKITIENRGPETATLHVLPDAVVPQHLGLGAARAGTTCRTIHGYDDGTLVAKHRILGRLVLAGEGEPEALVCDNESNAERLWGLEQPLAVPEGRHQRLHRGRRSRR